MAKAGWYDSGGKKGGSKPQSMPERHANERKDTHTRHAQARDALNKQHEAELEQMAMRQSEEMAQGDQGMSGNASAPAAAGPAPVPAQQPAGA